MFSLVDPIIDDIDIRDIAHALSLQCRWTGHSKFHYSVAQHSYYCSYLGPKQNALDHLMHDASEAYLSDMSRPLKYYTNVGIAYRLMETIMQNAIERRFNLRRQPASVHIADNQMLFAERDQLMGKVVLWNKSLTIHKDFGTAEIRIKEWSTRHAERMFLRRFHELYKGK
jgi:hypothetical protein